MTNPLTFSIDGHVAQVTLNRPDKANALNLEMFDALAQAADQIAEEPSVRAVVLHGAGGNFCAGIDVEIFAQDESFEFGPSMKPIKPSPANRFQRAAYAWRELPMPVICSITGVAFGGGLQIALGADLRYATAESRLSIMEVKWGLIPDMGISTTLRNVLPIDHVKELAWSGRTVGGEEALRLGLVTVLHKDPLRAALDMAAEISGKSPDAIRGMKQLFNTAWQLPDAEALALEAKLQLRILAGENQQEAVMSNLQKRPPKYSDSRD